MKNFFKGVGIFLICCAVVFCVGATTYAVNPDFKYWVDTEIIMTVEKTPEDEIPDVTPEDGADEGTTDNENGDSTTDDNMTGDNTSGDETDDDVIDVPTQGESSDENLENEEV